MDVDVEKPEVVPNRRFHGKTAKIGFFGLSSLYESFFCFFCKNFGFYFQIPSDTNCSCFIYYMPILKKINI